jgi:phenylpyruvate tautomerase PptA (4-oxalocrotonate tautomerase family)
MPIVRISMVRGRGAAERRAVSDAVHEAFVEAFKIPDGDYNHIIDERDGADFIRSGSKTDAFVLVEATVFPGRSAEAKKRLYERIAARLGALGIAPSDTVVILNEPAMEDWGLNGKPGTETRIGFKIDV